jgi:hypothetical protein
MASVRIRWSLYQFEASTLPHPPTIIVSRHGDKVHSRVFNEHDEKEEARQWLGDMGLDARQARRLIDAAIRNEGPFADPKHPRRVA